MTYIGSKPADKVLTASDITDGIISSAKIADGTIVNDDVNASAAIVASKLSGAGITVADQWRLTTSKTSDGDITANLERCDTGIQGTLGSAMTESSGIFTFPSTGIYQVLVAASFTGASENAMQVLIKGTADNSSYTTLALIYDGQRNATDTSGGSSGSTIVDITDTSTHKIKFAAGSLSAGSSVNGHDDENQTTFSFIRLGE